jgi:hypothetical protein
MVHAVMVVQLLLLVLDVSSVWSYCVPPIQHGHERADGPTNYSSPAVGYSVSHQQHKELQMYI